MNHRAKSRTKRVKERVFSKRRNHSHKAKENKKRIPIDIIKIGFTNRYEKGASNSADKSDTKHDFFLYKSNYFRNNHSAKTISLHAVKEKCYNGFYGY